MSELADIGTGGAWQTGTFCSSLVARLMQYETLMRLGLQCLLRGFSPLLHTYAVVDGSLRYISMLYAVYLCLPMTVIHSVNSF